MNDDDLRQLGLLDLFRLEAETQAEVLTSSLLALERDPVRADHLDLCMRAAHSLKGAARIVNLSVAVRVAHAMEDCFVAAQRGEINLSHAQIDALLGGTDILVRLAHTPEQDLGEWAEEQRSAAEAWLSSLGHLLDSHKALAATGGGDRPAEASARPERPAAPTAAPSSASVTPAARDHSDRVLRVTAEHLNRLLGLAGEALVESRWVKPFSESLLRLKRMNHDVCARLDTLREAIPASALNEQVQIALADAQRAALSCRQFLSDRLVDLEMFDRRSLHLSHRMYDEALTCRMRPFADGVQGFPRMVRDLAQSLGKQATLQVVGDATQVDREMLVKLDAPLGHLLRNALDHGLESPEERSAAGKAAEGAIRLEARHSAGALHVIVSDDGRGVDLERIRTAIVTRHLVTAETAGTLGETELLEFLFLPGFTMKDTVTDISGRGVGLDVVRDMVRQVRGTVRVTSQLGQGTRFLLQLPVTLSVARTLLAEIGGQPYAFPLAYIVRTLKLPRKSIALLEGRQHFEFEDRRVGLITAHQLFGAAESTCAGDELPVIVLGDAKHSYGLVVDRFLGERELVVQPLDVHLGKIENVSAGALMEDGAPVLIVDPEDLIRSMDRLVSGGRPVQVSQGVSVKIRKRKRVLVVDDSLTVRELERKLLSNHGYDVEVAVDGMDGWNAVRKGHFNLVVTDIDMPRMDGIELVTLINRDPNLKSIPVMVVSYKDRDEDRRRGLEAGAAYYLTKGSFHDETLLHAVVDLIGEAQA